MNLHRHLLPFRHLARFGLAALLLAFAAEGAQAQSTLAPPDWKQVNERDGIKTFVRHNERSKLKAFKGVVRMKIPDEYRLVTVLNDYDSYPKWLYLFDGAREVKRDGPLHRFLYLTTDMPWPAANRDMGVELTVRQAITPRDESIVIDIRNKDDLVPRTKGYVRVKKIIGTLTFQRMGSDELDVTFEALVDPAGRLPMWLVNVMASDIPYYTLSALRRLMLSPEWLPQYVDYLELRGPSRPADLPPARSYLYNNPPAAPLPELPLSEVNQGRH